MPDGLTRPEQALVRTWMVREARAAAQAADAGADGVIVGSRLVRAAAEAAEPAPAGRTLVGEFSAALRRL